MKPLAFYLFTALLTISAHASPITLTDPLPDGVTQAKACIGQAGAVQEGFRPLLQNGQYGPCVPTACGDGYDLSNGKCRPLQKAYFDVPSKVILMAPGESKTIDIKTNKPVSSGSIGISSGGSPDITVDGLVTFENESSKTITVTAGDLQEEDFLNINMVNATGKIAIKGNQSLTVKVIPQGLPKLTSIALDKASPTTADQNVTLTLNFSKSFSQSASTKLNFKVSGDKQALGQSAQKTVSVVVAKGQKTASVQIPLSGQPSNGPVTLNLNEQSRARINLTRQGDLPLSFSVAPAANNSSVYLGYSRSVNFVPTPFINKDSIDQGFWAQLTQATGASSAYFYKLFSTGSDVYTAVTLTGQTGDAFRILKNGSDFQTFPSHWLGGSTAAMPDTLVVTSGPNPSTYMYNYYYKNVIKNGSLLLDGDGIPVSIPAIDGRQTIMGTVADTTKAYAFGTGMDFNTYVDYPYVWDMDTGSTTVLSTPGYELGGAVECGSFSDGTIVYGGYVNTAGWSDYLPAIWINGNLHIVGSEFGFIQKVYKANGVVYAAGYSYRYQPDGSIEWHHSVLWVGDAAPVDIKYNNDWVTVRDLVVKGQDVYMAITPGYNQSTDSEIAILKNGTPVFSDTGSGMHFVGLGLK